MKLSNITSNLRAFSKEAAERSKKLENERETLNKERKAIVSAPLRFDDAERFLIDYIDACAAQFPRLAEWDGLFSRLLYPLRSQDVRRPDRNNTAPPLSLEDADTVLNDPNNAPNTVFGPRGLLFAGDLGHLRSDISMSFFHGKAIKAAILDYWDEVAPQYGADDANDVGLPVSERREKVAAIDARLAEIDTELAKIKDDLDELRGSMQDSSENAGFVESPEAAGQRMRDEERDLNIRKAFNGRNAEELARQYGVSARHVYVVGNAYRPA